MAVVVVVVGLFIVGVEAGVGCVVSLRLSLTGMISVLMLRAARAFAGSFRCVVRASCMSSWLFRRTVFGAGRAGTAGFGATTA